MHGAFKFELYGPGKFYIIADRNCLLALSNTKFKYNSVKMRCLKT